MNSGKCLASWACLSMILGKTAKRKAEAAYSRSQEEEIGLVYVESLSRQGKYEKALLILSNYTSSTKNHTYIQELYSKIQFLVQKLNLSTPKQSLNSRSKKQYKSFTPKIEY